MTTLNLILSILGTLATVVQNPNIGLSHDGVKIAGLLNLIAALGQEGEKAADGLIALNDQIKQLDAAGGPIPDDVWTAWETRHEAAKARLAAA